MTRRLFTITLILLLVNVLILFFVFPIKAQKRYLDPVFSQINKKTYTYFEKPGGESLELDVYTPTGDFQKNRPLILYIHGGGFSGGSKDTDYQIKFCEGYGKERLCCGCHELYLGHERQIIWL